MLAYEVKPVSVNSSSNVDTDVNYTENIFCDVVTRGLTDCEIQLDILSEKNQDMTLEEVFQFI